MGWYTLSDGLFWGKTAVIGAHFDDNDGSSSSPAGISCDGDCSETYVEETAVTLTATVSIGYFAGWSGAGCSGMENCVVTMNRTQEVTATFSLYTVFLPVIVR